MTPLEAAKRLAEASLPTDEMDGCWYCSEQRSPGRKGQIVHKPDCPYPSMSRIVAALEAAEQIAQRAAPAHHETCVFCWEAGKHATDCRYQALVAALRGEPA